MNMQVRVASTSNPVLVAGCIAKALRDAPEIEMRLIGAAAVNQAVKAIAVARGYLSVDGIEVASYPSFAEVSIGTETRTAIVITLRREVTL